MNIKFDQFPCFFSQYYSAFIFDEFTSEETPLPDFMSLDITSASFVIDKTEEGDDGIYHIIVYSKLDNYMNSIESTTFKVTINPEFNFVVDLPPLWEPKLID